MGGRCRREWTVTAWRALVHEAVAEDEPGFVPPAAGGQG